MGKRSIVRILSDAPTRVFALFPALLVLGLMQARIRTVRKIPALLLPAGMIALSLAGIDSSFGLGPLPLASWAGAVAIAVVVGHAMSRDETVDYDATEETFLVPGSRAPLAVIMAIFSAKYACAVMHAFNADVVSTPRFIVALSAVHGVLSGYLAARAFNLIRKAQMV